MKLPKDALKALDCKLVVAYWSAQENRFYAQRKRLTYCESKDDFVCELATIIKENLLTHPQALFVDAILYIRERHNWTLARTTTAIKQACGVERLSDVWLDRSCVKF